MRAEHAVIGGASDGGKTTLLREGHFEFDGQSIWVNHTAGAKDAFTEGVSGYHCRGRKSMHTGVGEFDDWSDVCLNLRCTDVREGTELAVEHAVDTWDTAGVPTQIIVDESHHLLSEDVDGDRSNPANWALAEGRDRGVKLIVATQNPKALDYTELPNARYWVWVGEYTTRQKAWFRHNEFPIDTLREQARFEYRVFNRSMHELHHGETQEEYA